MVFHFNIPSFLGIEPFLGLCRKITAIILGGKGAKNRKIKLRLIPKFAFKLPPPFPKDSIRIISFRIADIRHGDWKFIEIV